MLHATWDTDKIMGKFARMVDNISKVDVDAAVTEALNEVADFLLKEMQEGVQRHTRTGKAFDAVKRTDVQRTGNYQYVEVGAMYIRAEDRDGFHIVYLEYGSVYRGRERQRKRRAAKRAQAPRHDACE